MLKYDKCNWANRKALGFYSVECDSCDNGKLAVELIWSKRERQNKITNDFRLLVWKNKMLKYQNNI